MNVAFYILAGLAVAGASLALAFRNLVYAVLALILFFLAQAGLYLMLAAEFLAAAQVLVYVGGLGILILFAVMLTRRVTSAEARTAPGWIWGLLFAVLLFGSILAPVALTSEVVAGQVTAGMTVADLGKAIVNEGAPALWALALLLTAAVVAAISIAMPPARQDNKAR